MFFWKIKRVEEPVEKRDLVEEVKRDIVAELFEVVSGSCPYCGGSPMIKYEPGQFKRQCFTCYRITDKSNVYLDRSMLLAPESRWIFDRLNNKKDAEGKTLPPMTDAQYDEMIKALRAKSFEKVN